jgi:hypothetical protein
MSGDCIGVLVTTHATHRTMSFYRNGRRLGQAFRNIPRDVRLYPAATVYGTGTSATLLCDTAQVLW